MTSRRTLLAGLLAGTLRGGPLTGKRAPSFALPDHRQQYHDILDYRGKPLLLDFMQTFCPHCGPLAATLERVKRALPGQVNVLSVVTPPDTIQTVTQFIQKHRLSSPVLFDCGQTAAYYLQATPQNPRVSFPHLFLIDARGMIARDWPYSEADKSIFEGDALIPIVRKLTVRA